LRASEEWNKIEAMAEAKNQGDELAAHRFRGANPSCHRPALVLAKPKDCEGDPPRVGRETDPFNANGVVAANRRCHQVKPK
jgi:hypothetical protein